MKILCKTAIAIAAAVALPQWALAATAVLQDGYVKTGVSDYGTLGSNSGTPPGILFDATGAGAYGINDFLTPGTPFEGFYITAGTSSSWYANNTGDTTFDTASPVSLSATSASWSALSTDGNLRVTNLYTLTTVSGRSAIAVNTQIENLGTRNLTDVNFLRTLDPDPDVNAYGDYNTDNSVVSAQQSCGTGLTTGQTICILNTSSSFTGRAGVSSDWTENPAAYLAGLDDGDGDFAIGLAYSLGTLAAGSTLSLDYAYALGASRDVVVIVPGIPEPETYALMLLGLAGVAAAARRRKA